MGGANVFNDNGGLYQLVEVFKMADEMQELCDCEKRRLDNVEKNR